MLKLYDICCTNNKLDIIEIWQTNIRMLIFDSVYLFIVCEDINIQYNKKILILFSEVQN